MLSFPINIVDLDPTMTTKNIQSFEVIHEIWKNDQDTLIAYRNGIRHVGRLAFLKSALIYSDLTIPSSERFQVILPKSKSIADLEFGIAVKQVVLPEEVEIKVNVAGLNFRDVFSVLKPTSEFEMSNTIGNDFSGTISRVGTKVSKWNIGNAVMGINTHNQSLPSHVIVKQNEVVALPDNWTFSDGATLPCAFATAYQCLAIDGKLTKGQTVLIHAGSGAVGLCLIQLAKLIGANIVTTAGSNRKRKYLRNLGIQFVFDSRSVSFGKEIQENISKECIDLVVNSLTGPGFKEASLNCCKQNATFIEMSKLNIWSTEEIAALRPDVKYVIVDLSTSEEGKYSKLMQAMETFTSLKNILPLPTTKFNATNIRDGLKYLEKAKHIGKVIIEMPTVRTIDGLVELKLNLFNDRSIYLVTGGLQGVGLEVAKWMTKNGAKHLILCGRTNPSEETLNAIQKLKDNGNIVHVIQTDIGNIEECQSLLSKINNSLFGPYPLKGVMHAAGCLSDATIAKQTWEKFETTMHPKVKGGWNLHMETKDLNLEFFVLFSSIAAIMGSPGQSNHAASNSYVDALANYRHSIGLPALSINWGQWGETGVAVDVKNSLLIPMRSQHALNTMEHALKSNVTQLVACDGIIKNWKDLIPWAKTYLSEIKIDDPTKKEHHITISSDKFWAELNAAEGQQQKYEVIYQYLSKMLKITLRIDESEIIDKHTEFQELGMDSLMMIEFKNLIQTVVGSTIVLNPTDLQDANTLDRLTNKMVEIIYSNNKINSEEAAKALWQLVDNDAKLWPYIQGDGLVVKPSEVKTVLLTGSTGTLGPFMLRALTQMSAIKRVYCLIRADKSKTPLDKLMQRLKTAELLDDIDMNKVEVISGDIAQVGMGIADELYELLASEVEAVVHVAVNTSHLEPYLKTDTKFASMRTVNVTGTQRILEFAASKRTKLVYNASTAFAAGNPELEDAEETENVIPEAWPEPLNRSFEVNFGYAISSYVAEQLIAQATEERKIPCKNFRFGVICGDSERGRQICKRSHFFLKFCCYLKSGIVPDLDLPMQLVPVDQCAEISLAAFFSDDAPVGVYNVMNPHNVNEIRIVEIGPEFELPCRLDTYSEFAKKVEEDGRKSLVYPWKELYTMEDSVGHRYEKNAIPVPFKKAWLHEKDFFRQGKLHELFPDLVAKIDDPMDIFRRDLKYAVEKYDIFNS